MKILSILLSLFLANATANAQKTNTDFHITKVQINHHANIDLLVWEISVKGEAGATTPTPAGQLNGAPVSGYVFPTSLKSSDVGFGNVEGIVAMALTSHPDFDDTPLWDENADNIFDNDGTVWHAHWVVLNSDERVPGGLSVVEFDPEDQSVVMPPTAPGMPLYLDSPGFAVTTKGSTIKVLIPQFRIKNKTQFNYDGVAAFMKVNTEDKNLPMLGVYEVWSVASGDLSLPYTFVKDQ